MRLSAQRRSRELGVQSPSETTLRVVRSFRLQESSVQARASFHNTCGPRSYQKNVLQTGRRRPQAKHHPNVFLQIALKRGFALSVLAAAGVLTAAQATLCFRRRNGSLRSSREHCAETTA